MQKQTDRIDPLHSRAIAAEIGERLGIELLKDNRRCQLSSDGG